MRRTRSNSTAGHISFERRTLRGSRTSEMDLSENLKPQRRSHNHDNDNYARSSPRRKVARLASDCDGRKESYSSPKLKHQNFSSRHYTRAAKNSSALMITKVQKNGVDIVESASEKQRLARVRRKVNSVSESQESEVSEQFCTPCRVTRNVSKRTQSLVDNELSLCKIESSIESSHDSPNAKLKDVHEKDYEKQIPVDGLSKSLRSSRVRCSDCGKPRASSCQCQGTPTTKLSSSKQTNSIKATDIKQEDCHSTEQNNSVKSTENDADTVLPNNSSGSPRLPSDTGQIDLGNIIDNDGECLEPSVQPCVDITKENSTKRKGSLEVEESVACDKISIIDEFRNIEVDYCGVMGEDCIPINHKRRKMNLRSSGVSCNPDYYALSLELIKKSRSRQVNGVLKNLTPTKGMQQSSNQHHSSNTDEISAETQEDTNFDNGEKMICHGESENSSLGDVTSRGDSILPSTDIPCDLAAVGELKGNFKGEKGEFENRCTRKVTETFNDTIAIPNDSLVEQESCNDEGCTESPHEVPEVLNSSFKRESYPTVNISENDSNCMALPNEHASTTSDDDVTVEEQEITANKICADASDYTADKTALIDNDIISAKPRCLSTLRKRRGNVKQKHKETKVLQKLPKVHMILRDPSEPPSLFEDEALPRSDVYYFESDHVALKHNKDYQNLLQAVAVLEAQRHQCLQDIETLNREKTEHLGDPVAFVEKLQNKSNKEYCRPQTIQELPDICWSKYSSQYGTFSNVFANDAPSSSKPVTRKVKLNFESGVPMQSISKQIKKQTNRPNNSVQSSRVSWTVEEQLKLEGLLEKYPSEAIEFNRFRKIAAELGNRTPLQVQSRVQKYFIKLTKAGLPVPGNKPRINRQDSIGISRNKRARSHPQQGYLRMSTFFPSLHCPVQMKMDDSELPCSSKQYYSDTETDDLASDDDDIPEELRHCQEYIEIRRLKKLRQEKLQVLDNKGGQALAQHIGFACDVCDNDPIQGVRYHCIDCPQDSSVDLCQSCIRFRGQFTTENHMPSHRMEPVYESQNFQDDDYMKFVSPSGEYNYLDPNFHPAGI